MPRNTSFFESWSFSRYNDWVKCPAFAKYRHLEKIQTKAMVQRAADMAAGKIEPGPLERGDDIDKKSTAFFKGPKTAKVPIELMPVAALYRQIKARGNLTVNDSWGFDRKWMACSPTDFQNCWLRVKVDFGWIIEGTKKKPGDVLEIRDQKTGKFNDRKAEEYKMQLELYGTAGLARMPTVTEVTAQLIYSDLGVLHPAEPMRFNMEQLGALQKLWNGRVKPMFAERRFAPRPGHYCSYCEFSKSKGGPCKY